MYLQQATTKQKKSTHTQGGHLFLVYLWWSFFCSAKDEIYINVSEYLHGMRNNAKKSELMNGERETCILYGVVITLLLH